MAESIEDLSEARAKSQAAGDQVETERLTKALDTAYDDQRRNLALMLHGSTEQIQKRARIALELEKLSRL